MMPVMRISVIIMKDMKNRRIHMKATFILSLAMAILIAIFALLNGGTVPVNLGFANLESSLALVILVSVAIGAIIIYLIDVVGKFKSAYKIKELEKKIAVLEKENAEKSAVISKLSQVDASSSDKTSKDTNANKNQTKEETVSLDK